MKSDSFVSVVVLWQSRVPEFSKQLVACHHILAKNYSDYEMIIIEQGPFRKGSEFDVSLLKALPSLRVIRLSSEVSTDVAWGAGLENAIGDFVILLDLCSDPVSLIPDLVQQCRSGVDVIVGTAKKNRSVPYRLFRVLAGMVLKAADYELPKDATALRCLSRRAVNAVTKTGRFHHQLYMRIQKVGFSQQQFPYDLIGPVPPKSFLGGARSLMHLLVFNSSRPLRWMSALGIAGSLIALCFGLYSVILHLVTENVVQGWTSTVVALSSLFLIQFIMLAFFGEYLGRLLDEKGTQSEYSVVTEQRSDIMVDADRVNVLVEPTTADPSKVQTGRSQ